MPSSNGHSGYNHPSANAASTQNLMPSSGLSSANSSTKDVTSSSSLSVNYLPQKFGGLRNRSGVPRGGGREAFGPGAARMAGDDDYDAVGWPGSKDKRKRRWNKFKWTLFFANLLVRIPCEKSQADPFPAGHHLFHPRPHRLSADLVQRVGGRRHRARGQPARAHQCAPAVFRCWSSLTPLVSRQCRPSPLHLR